MLMSRIFTFLLLLSLGAAILCGTGKALAASILQGAQSGVTLAVSMTGAVCLWSGVGKLMQITGLTQDLSRLLRPALSRIFPETKTDPILAGDLSANICANFLGLGNAATPMGIRAAKRLTDPAAPQGATDSLCRLIVLNTASIQLLPTNVAAIRSALGSPTPFDILPGVWVSSILSAGLGLTAAWLLGKVWKHA